MSDDIHISETTITLPQYCSKKECQESKRMYNRTTPPSPHPQVCFSSSSFKRPPTHLGILSLAAAVSGTSAQVQVFEFVERLAERRSGVRVAVGQGGGGGGSGGGGREESGDGAEESDSELHFCFVVGRV